VLGKQLILQITQADTFVPATNRKKICDFVNMSFAAADVSLEWSGSGTQESAVDTASGCKVVCVNPRYCRPAQVDLLIGDATKAKTKLGWAPTTNLKDLCKMMVAADL